MEIVFRVSLWNNGPSYFPARVCLSFRGFYSFPRAQFSFMKLNTLQSHSDWCRFKNRKIIDQLSTVLVKWGEQMKGWKIKIFVLHKYGRQIKGRYRMNITLKKYIFYTLNLLLRLRRSKWGVEIYPLPQLPWRCVMQKIVKDSSCSTYTNVFDHLPSFLLPSNW